MDQALRESISGWLEGKVEAVGFAPVERFHDAPDKHHPSLVCKDAATVIALGKTTPRAVLSSPGYNLHLLQRSYHTIYPLLDELGLELANRLEKQGHLAVQVPSYAPMVFHDLEPWGILSLKHAAVRSGLGAFGRSGMVYHPEHGSLLRLGAVVTSAELPGDPVMEEEPCPPDCTACRKSCPPGAYQDDSFQKMTCLGHTIKHGIYKLALTSAEDFQFIERIINTTGYNYWLDCDECLKVCPLNRRKK